MNEWKNEHTFVFSVILHCQVKKKKFLQSCTYLILQSAYQYLNVTNMHLFIVLYP